ncbi:hypothetical protein EJB05_43451 [Eragrostis curvula]|uniref:Uncharacterized protein n=1 Tax=Eragrostis curvula TaxID=38414 RepID=A0A5J9TFA2_9POAL|nr:hypothetical protein EJB05_43451 [Eragrostis curvula]
MPFLVQQSGEISRSGIGRDEGSIMALLCRKPALFSCPPSHWSARISRTIYAVRQRIEHRRNGFRIALEISTTMYNQDNRWLIQPTETRDMGRRSCLHLQQCSFAPCSMHKSVFLQENALMNASVVVGTVCSKHSCSLAPHPTKKRHIDVRKLKVWSSSGVLNRMAFAVLIPFRMSSDVN